MLSVIIPVYNAEKTVGAALESVVLQDFIGEMEIIVVNDGCTDGSMDIVSNFKKNHSKYHIRIISQKNAGAAAARNRGLLAASGEFIALLDADDQWLAGKIRKQIALLKAHPEIKFLATYRVGQRALLPFYEKNGMVKARFWQLLLRNEIVTPTVIFRNEILQISGNFDENLRFAEDLEYWIRIAKHTNLYILAEPLARTGHGKRSFGVAGLSANLPAMERGFQTILLKLYRDGTLGRKTFLALKVLYRIKYAVRIARHQFLTLINR